MKLDRLIAVIMILLERRITSAKYLSEMFHVSLRTVYRDIVSINAAGIPVVSSPGIGGGFHIIDGYKIDKKLFTDSDIVTLLMGLGSISSALDTAQLTSTLAKVKSCIPESKHSDITWKTNQITVDLQPWMGNTASAKHIKLINEAIMSNSVIHFCYFNKNGESSNRRIEPNKLIMKGSHWYLQGFCLEKNDYRIFKLSRVHKLAQCSESFLPRLFPNSVSAFTEKMAKKQSNIKIFIHKSIIDSVLSYCDAGCIVETSLEHYTIQFPFIDDDVGYGILLSFGDKCECLEPESVRKEMSKRIAALAKLYAKA